MLGNELVYYTSNPPMPLPGMVELVNMQRIDNSSIQELTRIVKQMRVVIHRHFPPWMDKYIN